MRTLALTGEARRWDIKKFRFRLFSAAARLSAPVDALPSACPTDGPGPDTSSTASPDSANSPHSSAHRTEHPDQTHGTSETVETGATTRQSSWKATRTGMK
ncbi:hypothetical protein [Embleya sp. NPDC020886]|uniref:hypothetical protein n=1 Tax=Embleya sp. NPDC020886 TaxID=3363980 RepID=UPI0037AABC15